MTLVEITIMLVGALALGLVTPMVFVVMSHAALRQNPSVTTTNFRGRSVSYGLGIVWLVWAGTAMVAGVGASWFSLGTVLEVLAVLGPLALVAFALGILDDAYGTGDARGFRGHLKAMLKGRMTTGGLKLLGLGSASLVVATVVSRVAPWGNGEFGIGLAAKTLAAGAAIALTSNFVNLTDLRPGRALKVYSVLAICGVASTVAALRGVSAIADPVEVAAQAGALLVFVMGPVVAVWRYDLGELGMLGDAGANPMGAVAGLMIAIGLPLWGLIAYLVLMLGLNMASERFSYTRIIESVSVLRWLDGLGRLPDSPATGDGVKTVRHS